MIADTSKESYQSLLWEGTINRDELKYLTALKLHGNFAPDFMIKSYLGWEHSTVSARRNGCVKKGLVKYSGQKMQHLLRNSKGDLIKRTVKVWQRTPRFII